MYVSGNGIYTIITKDKFLEYLSNRGKIMLPYTKSIGENDTLFFSSQFISLKNEDIQVVTLLKTKDFSFDPFVSHKSKC